MRSRVFLPAFLLLSVFFFSGTGFAGKNMDLYNKYRRAEIVKVYVDDIKNSTGKDAIDVKDLKATLEKVLAERKSIKFKVVKHKDHADIIIGCEASDYYWQEDDPIDMIMSTALLAVDLVTTENFAFMDATFTVTDAKSDKLLWEKRLKVDLTKKDMPQAKSVHLINEKVVKIFMRDCFSKKSSRQ